MFLWIKAGSTETEIAFNLFLKWINLILNVLMKFVLIKFLVLTPHFIDIKIDGKRENRW